MHDRVWDKNLHGVYLALGCSSSKVLSPRSWKYQHKNTSTKIVYGYFSAFPRAATFTSNPTIRSTESALSNMP